MVQSRTALFSQRPPKIAPSSCAVGHACRRASTLLQRGGKDAWQLRPMGHAANLVTMWARPNGFCNPCDDEEVNSSACNVALAPQMHPHLQQLQHPAVQR